MARAEAAAAPVLDLVHLSRQSLGDRGLEVELLRLFDAQAAQVIGRLTSGAGRAERRWRADLAHTLKGSALAVGAGAVAAEAASFENALYGESGEAELERRLAALSDAVATVRARIADLLQDA
jgi:HPt (histidine-containing phosphotransfer) domain-containing protein